MSEHWRQRPEGGGRFGLWLIFTSARLLGRHVSRWLLYPISVYFCLRRGPERRAARVFLQRLNGRPAGIGQVLAHMHRYAGTLLDRVFFLLRGERGFRIEVEGLDVMDRHLQAGRGLLLFGAHMGSFEVLRTLAVSHAHVPLRIVLNTRQTPVMSRLLASLAPDLAARIIDGNRSPAHVVLAVSESIRQGHMVALLADRGRPGETMQAVPFAGRPAPFPVGPWQLAARLDAPVVLCMGLYLGGNRYRLSFETLAERVELARHAPAEALQPYLARYAARLEHHARQQPCNWFNFYDFWEEGIEDAGEAAEDAAGAAADASVTPRSRGL